MKSLNNKDLALLAQWKEPNRQRYIHLNFQNCTDEERIQLSRHVINMINEEELNSVNLFVDVRNTTISVESMRATKDDWIKATPYIARVSMLGVSGTKSMLFKLWGFMTSMKVKICKTEDEGIKYLIAK